MKLLYITNEQEEGDQVGPRAALGAITEAGKLKQTSVFTFLVEEKRLGGWVRTLTKLLDVIKDIQPEFLVFTHLGHHVISENYINTIKTLYSVPPVIAYDERDVYGVLRKPLPAHILVFAKACDVTFLVARGSFAHRFRKAGCKNVQYLSHVGNTVGFGQPWDITSTRDFDIVLIANLHNSRLPWMNMPGTRERRELAKKLYRNFGDRFALYGRGWNRMFGCRGSIPFIDQEKIMRNSWLSIGYDHFPSIESYFSDRLPIALLSGVGHITKKTEALEEFFVDREHCVFYETVDEAVELCQEMLSWPKKQLIDLGLRGSEFARKNFTEDVRMNTLVDKISAIYNLKTAIRDSESPVAENSN